jgi:hypothetical protein
MMRVIDYNFMDLATLTASSESGSLVVENLKTDIKSQVWRTGSTSANITAILPSAVNINAVVFSYTNLSNGATLRVRGYTNTTDIIGTDSPVFDTTSLPCCNYTASSVFGWDINTPAVVDFGYGAFVYASLFFTGGSVRKLYIEIADSGNSSGYIEAGRLICGYYWEPTFNADYGIQLGFDDQSNNSRNNAGDLLSDVKPRFKNMTFSLGNFSAADREKIMRMLRINGTSNGIYFTIFPDDSDKNKEQDYQIYGKLAQNPMITMPWFDRFSGSFTINEI